MIIAGYDEIYSRGGRAMASFKLPKDGAIYANSIFSRCHDLIAYEVWSGIEPHRLDAWIGNFTTAEERYFAARVLDNLIYRPDKQTVALMKQMLQRVIPDLARCEALDADLLLAYQSLQDTSNDPLIRIVPVIPPHEPLIKSGGIIARMLRRQLNISQTWIVDPQDIKPLLGQVKSFIFVDDFLGTGSQFSSFVSDAELVTFLSATSCIYAPLVAHLNGISALRRDYPDLHIDTVELLDDSHALFHEKAGSFPDDVNSCESARDFYYELLRSKKIEIDGPDRRGFGHFELVYAFEHAVPDNSLPILWWRDSPHWQSLFTR